MNYPKTEAIKEIRKAARDVGLTFKTTNTNFNGSPLYCLVTRNTGVEVMSSYQFWTAYNDFLSGYISSWDGSKFNDPRNM